jgi:hypothetical protein
MSTERLPYVAPALRELPEADWTSEIRSFVSESRGLSLVRSEAPWSAQLCRMRETVQAYWPLHWPFVEALASAVATLGMRGVGQSLALFGVGPSGTGKSTGLYFFGVPEGEELALRLAGAEPLVEQLDRFTIPSFLSHYTDEKGSVLEDRALAKQLKHRVLLTPELAPTFRGKRESLEIMFGNLALVLDGEGLRTHSGAHGALGTKGDFSFVWLGGTTPFRIESWKTMAQLGTRLLFYRVARDADTCPRESYYEARNACRDVTNELLAAFFGAVEKRSRAWPRITPRIDEEIRRLADLTAKGQAQTDGLGSENEAVRPASAHFNMRLALLACGRALLHGREEVTADDLPLIRHVAASSMPSSRGPVLMAMYEGARTVPEILQRVDVGLDAVRRTLQGLRRVEVVRPVDVDDTNVGRPANVWELQP